MCKSCGDFTASPSFMPAWGDGGGGGGAADTHDEIKRKMIEAGRILEAAGQGDWTRGHISVRLPDDPERFYMKANNMGLEEITPDKLIICGLDGTKLEGDQGRHSEVFIHSEVLRARPDVNAVIHTHAPYAVMFSSLDKPLQPIGHAGSIFAEGLPVFSETTELITTKERGEAVARTLGEHQALLLQNHGIVTCAPSMEQAIYLALSLENACMMQMWVESAGGARRLGDTTQIKAKRKHMFREEMFKVTFAYLARRLNFGKNKEG